MIVVLPAPVGPTIAIFWPGRALALKFLIVGCSLPSYLNTTSINIDETGDEIVADVKYGLDINFEYVGDCHITVHIKQKGSSINIG